jgi:Phospholipase_D-nuclease N-terminal
MLRVLPEIIWFGLLVFCLIDCVQTPDGDVRNLPKWAWIMLMILLPLVGSVAWLVAGRPEHSARQRSRAPWPSTATAGYPEYERPPRGPDDDVEFLRGIKRADNEHEDVLRKWEDDLRRREQQLSRDDSSDDDTDEEPKPPTG